MQCIPILSLPIPMLHKPSPKSSIASYSWILQCLDGKPSMSPPTHTRPDSAVWALHNSTIGHKCPTFLCFSGLAAPAAARYRHVQLEARTRNSKGEDGRATGLSEGECHGGPLDNGCLPLSSALHRNGEEATAIELNLAESMATQRSPLSCSSLPGVEEEATIN